MIIIGLKVKAGAKANKIKGFIEINNKKYLQLSLQARAIDGKANTALIDFLSKEWSISKASLQIASGFTCSFKILTIKNIESTYLKSILNNYI